MTLLEAYPHQFTYGIEKTIIVNIFFWGGVFITYALRKTEPFTTLWRLVVMFFLVLFGTLFFNNIKDKLKDWFK
jgi:hypothetical protein